VTVDAYSKTANPPEKVKQVIAKQRIG